MVLLLIYWGYLALFFLLAGFFVVRLMVFYKPGEVFKNLTAGFLIFIGIAATTVLFMGASIFIPVHEEAHLAMAVGLTVYTLLDREAVIERMKRSVHSWKKNLETLSKPMRRVVVPVLGMAAIVLAGFVTFLSNGEPAIFDTGLYHAQMVKWIQEYAAVPGLANIHGRFGFNNSWFVTAALVEVGPFAGKSYHVINSFAYLVLLGMVLARLFKLTCRPMTMSTLFCLPLLFLLVQFEGPEGERAANSLSTDIPSSLFLLAGVVFFLEGMEEDSFDRQRLGLGTLLVSFAVTIKLVAVPLLLIPIGWIVKQGMSERRLTKRIGWSLLTVGSAMVVVLAPWLVRGVVTSGYVLYPSTVLDVFHVDWKVPKELVINDLQSVIAWARVAGEPPSQVIGHGFLSWLPRWTDRNDWHLWLTAFFIIAFFLSSVLFTPRLRPLIKKYGVFHLTLTSGLIYWFASAPDTRFAWGYFVAIECLITASAGLILIGGSPSLGKTRSVAILVVCCLTASVAPVINSALSGVQKVLRNEPLSSYPAPVNRKEVVYSSGAKLYVCDELCYDGPLPTVPRYDPRDPNGHLKEKKYFLALRGETHQEGFRFTERRNSPERSGTTVR